jgi:hypothetical protein
MYAVEYGTAKRQEGFASLTSAKTWAIGEQLDNFEIYDDSDRIVYQEFPQPKWI